MVANPNQDTTKATRMDGPAGAVQPLPARRFVGGNLILGAQL